MTGVKTGRYFEEAVLPKRPSLRREWCERVLADPIRREVRADGRVRCRGAIPELGGRVLRVVSLEDGETVHNAFPDRRLVLLARPPGPGGDMKLRSDPETDSLYIDLNAKPSVDSDEVAGGVVLDVDAGGRPVGIDVQHASRILDLSTLETTALPARTLAIG